MKSYDEWKVTKVAGIRDVAKKANVAACTVSRVLNGSANVTPETKKRIEEAMRELNYIPNELARGMFRQKAGIVAMLVPNIRHPFFSTMATYIEDELYKNGYKMMLCSTGDDISREKEYLHILKSNIVDGVIMGVNGLDKEEYEQFEKPLVMLDYQVNDQIPLIVSDHKMGGRLAAEQFIRSGCSYVVHITSEKCDKEVESYQCHKVLKQELDKAGIQSREVEIAWNTFDDHGYLELARLILKQYPQIDGVMAADMPASAFIKAAVSLGRRIPEDLAIVAYDGTFVVNTNIMEITTICQPVEKIGIEAVHRILGLIDGKKGKDTKKVFPVTVNQGATTAVLGKEKNEGKMKEKPIDKKK